MEILSLGGHGEHIDSDGTARRRDQRVDVELSEPTGGTCNQGRDGLDHGDDGVDVDGRRPARTFQQPVPAERSQHLDRVLDRQARGSGRWPTDR
jgi:hypothetical protein